MKRLNNEKGYGLLLALAILLLVSVLGIGLMGLSLSGAKRTESRENIVQSGNLSTKGIEFIEKTVQTELVASLGEAGMSVDNFQKKLEQILNEYKCNTGKTLKSGDLTTGKYETCIVDYVDFKTTIEGKVIRNPLKKEVEFKSTGIVGGKEEVTYSTISFGAQSFPEVLKYAIGTNKDSTKCKSNSDEGCGNGNLILNGGVNIEGDMKVDGHLITTNNGLVRSGTRDYWIPSVLPQISSVKPNAKSKLILGGNSFNFIAANDKYNKGGTLVNRTALTYPEHYRGEHLKDSKHYKKESNLNNLFYNEYGPEIFKTEPKENKVKIVEEKKNYQFNQNTSNRLELDSEGRIHNINGNKRVASPSTKVTTRECVRTFLIFCLEYKDVITYNENGPFIFTGTNSFDKFSTIGKGTLLDTNTTFNQTAYFGEGLAIGNGSENNPSNVTLEGKIYVDGNLDIRGANLTSNTIFYVDGDVDIRYSTITGKKNDNKNILGSLIIFATGNINLANNSVNQSNPSHIKGYFYSEKDLEIYGVGSNIKVEGGLSARRIVLNAVRGEASNSSYDSRASYQPYSNSSYYESRFNQETLPRDKSRLQVIYDSDIIESYLGLVDSEPWIDTIEDPFVIDRDYKGKIKK